MKDILSISGLPKGSSLFFDKEVEKTFTSLTKKGSVREAADMPEACFNVKPPPHFFFSYLSVVAAAAILLVYVFE